MEIVDLAPQYEDSYLVCLEDWSDEMVEAGDHKARWYTKMAERGLRVKLAIGGDGHPVGMIQYVPIGESPALGNDLYMVLCVWVHGHKKGVGNQQGHGIGTQLLEAAEQDVLDLGAKGIAAWGVALPFWMRASWFKKHGYVRADRVGIRALMWKPFSPDADAPKWIKPGQPPPRAEGKVTISAFVNGWCPASNIVFERSMRAAAEFGDDVVFETVDTSEQSTMIRCGQSDCVFVDGRTLQKGPPPSYAKVHRIIAKRVAKLRH